MQLLACRLVRGGATASAGMGRHSDRSRSTSRSRSRSRSPRGGRHSEHQEERRRSRLGNDHAPSSRHAAGPLPTGATAQRSLPAGFLPVQAAVALVSSLPVKHVGFYRHPVLLLTAEEGQKQ